MNANSKILLYGLGKTNTMLFQRLRDAAFLRVGSDYSEELKNVDESFHWNPDVDALEDFNVVYVPPGILPNHRIHSHVNVRNELDYSLPLMSKNAQIIGITGTNGKSSLCKLLGDYLASKGFRVAIVGNYGLPACSVVDQSLDYVIVELSSFQLYSMHEKVFDVSMITGFEPDHLDWHPNLEHYRESKFKLQNLTRDGKIWIPQDLESWFDEYKIFSQSKASLDSVVSGRLNNFILFEQARVLLTELGHSCQDLKDFEFEALPHRREVILAGSGMKCVNDSKSTTPGATFYALSESNESRINLIIGGKLKGLSIASFIDGLLPFVGRLEKVFIYGELVAHKDSFGRLGIALVCSTKWADLLSQLEMHKPWGDLLLLSPGCSSLDQFSSFEERGQSFKDFVLRQ